MSYNIGQFRRPPNIRSFYITLNNPVISTEDYYTYSSESDLIVFNDRATSQLQDLNENNCYYLKFKVNNTGSDSSQSFKLKLVNNTTEQFIDEFTVNKNKNGIFEVIICPNNTYTQIVWELKRTINDDYNNSNNNNNNYIGRVMNITILCYGKLVNILDNMTGVNTLKKIGIQGPPSLLMCINREPIRIGKSGIYEINKENISINSISFMPTSSPEDENISDHLDYFIMDFEY